MDFDFTSFVLGAIASGAILFFKGFAEEIGKQTAHKVREKFFPEPVPPPPPPEPVLVQVGRQFQPVGEHAGHCVWARQADLFVRQQEGYTFYTQDDPNQRFYRDIAAGREFLMVRPSHLR